MNSSTLPFRFLTPFNLSGKGLKTARRIVMLFFVAMMYLSVHALDYNVTSFTDGTGAGTLRGSINAANGSIGPHRIFVPAGTYDLTLGTLKFGNLAGQTITIQATGGVATINMAGTGSNRDRIFTINYDLQSGVTVYLKNLKLTNGYASSDQEAGGAILCSGPGSLTDIDNCTFENNTVRTDIQIFSSGGAICATGGGTLNVINSTFTGNSSPGINNSVSVKRGSGGAIFFELSTDYPSGTLSVTDSKFNNNTAGGPASSLGGIGGAISIQTGPSGTGRSLSVSIARNSFTNNKAVGTSSSALDGGDGGAVWISNDYQGTNINYNRFYNNTGDGNGSAMYIANRSGNIGATNNWWGCNSGPTACADKAYSVTASRLTATPYLQLRPVATPSICAGSSVSVGLGFTFNSADNSIAPANLTAFSGLLLTFSATQGDRFPLSASIADGVAATTYTSTSSSNGTVNAAVDNVPNTDATAKANITVTPLTVPTGAGSTTITKNVTGTTTFSDANCKIITVLTPGTTSPLSGSVTAKVTIDNSVQKAPNGNFYVQRHYDIEPATNAAVATATITLYFKQTEFDDFNTANNSSVKLPLNGTDAANNKANIRIFQYHGTGTAPGNYTGTGELINPDDDKIVYESADQRWAITFNVTGFSGFYLGVAGASILPVKLASFSGVEKNNQVLLDWTTASEENTDHFEIEKSTDGIHFTTAGNVKAAGNSNSQLTYHFTDNSGVSGLIYYRIKTVDKDGRVGYSSVITIKADINSGIVTITPNPFSSQVVVNITAAANTLVSLSVTDMNGRLIHKQTTAIRQGSNALTIEELNHLGSGVYLLQVNGEGIHKSIRLVKNK